jgi:hypothetical protein
VFWVNSSTQWLVTSWHRIASFLRKLFAALASFAPSTSAFSSSLCTSSNKAVSASTFLVVAWQKPKAHSEARTETDGEVRLRSFYLTGSGMPLLAYLAGL